MSLRRIFFGLPCSEAEKAELARWRETHLDSVRAKWVPEANLHLTLAFIGPVVDERMEQALSLGDGIRGRAFQLQLTRLGHWGRGRVVWLAPDETPEALTELVEALNQGLDRLAFPTDERAYRPHLTLARKALVRDIPNIKPDITLTIDRFALFESVPEGGGVRYDALKTWKLD